MLFDPPELVLTYVAVLVFLGGAVQFQTQELIQGPVVDDAVRHVVDGQVAGVAAI